MRPSRPKLKNPTRPTRQGAEVIFKWILHSRFVGEICITIEHEALMQIKPIVKTKMKRWKEKIGRRLTWTINCKLSTHKRCDCDLWLDFLFLEKVFENLPNQIQSAWKWMEFVDAFVGDGDEEKITKRSTSLNEAFSKTVDYCDKVNRSTLAPVKV